MDAATMPHLNTASIKDHIAFVIKNRIFSGKPLDNIKLKQTSNSVELNLSSFYSFKNYFLKKDLLHTVGLNVCFKRSVIRSVYKDIS